MSNSGELHLSVVTWSRHASCQAYDADGRRVGWSDRSAITRKVRWRFDRKGRTAVFGVGEKSQADALVRRVAAAHLHGWEADERGWPLDPAASWQRPDPEPDPALEEEQDELPAAGITIEALAAAYGEYLRGRNLATNTLTGYLDALAFAVAHLRLDVDDPRCSARYPWGSSLPAAWVTEADCFDLLITRRGTNLRTRARNERLLARWAKAANRAEARARRTGQRSVLPPLPELEHERLHPRSEEMSAAVWRRMFEWGVLRGLIAHSPWTDAVAEEVLHPDDPVVYPHQVLSHDQLWQLADATARRSVTVPGAVPVTYKGNCFRALVLTGGMCGLRPAELVGLSPADVVDLHGRTPHLFLQGGITAVSSRYSRDGASRELRPLKHRASGTRRTVPIPRTLVPVLAEHITQFCPDADGPLFPSVTGRLLDPSNFADDWLRPAALAAFGPDAPEHLRNVALGSLRKAAITWWLLERKPLLKCAQWAGNTPTVIEKHYAGVIEQTSLLTFEDDSPAISPEMHELLAAFQEQSRAAEQRTAEIAAQLARAYEQISRLVSDRQTTT